VTSRVAVELPPASARGGRRTGRGVERVIGTDSGLAWPVLLLAGFAAAVLLRSAVGGVGVARSPSAGLVFALVLLGLCVLGRSAPAATSRHASGRRGVGRALAVGCGGAVVLCVPALVHLALVEPSLDARPHTAFVGWAAVVTVVATAEEVFLRGVLFDHLERHGTAVAIAVPALAFAALHLPLYGWGAVPLDLAVGVWLGALRSVSNSWVAPVAAHVLADWAAWWLV
jgi:membrane protease YdiL (CAAX protease family)